MNSTIIEKRERELNWLDLIWDLLEQWKAVLITALVVMVLVTGAKYAKDMKKYKTDQQEKAARETVSTEEQIDRILKTLPEKEQSVVLAIINQNELIESEMDYLNNSILMKTDPANQRMLVADYYISTDNQTASSIASLLHAYKTSLNSDNAVEKLKEVIEPETENNYITELISFDNTASPEESNAYDAVLKVQVVLPEYADYEKVEELIRVLISEYSAEFNEKICPHNIVLISADELHKYNADAIKKRNDTVNIINTQQQNIINAKSRLSDDQMAAVEAIMAVKTASSITDNTADAEKQGNARGEELKHPIISKKHALFGFMIGVFLYAIIYFVIYVMKDYLHSPGDTECFTKSRLFGEIYHRVEHTGFDALFHSKLVDKYRYRGKLDENVQVQKAASKLETMCKYTGTDDVSVLCMSELTGVKRKIIEAIKSKDLGVSVTEIYKQTDDKYLLSLKNTVLILGDDIKNADVMSLAEQLTDYGVNLLGSVYYSRI